MIRNVLMAAVVLGSLIPVSAHADQYLPVTDSSNKVAFRISTAKPIKLQNGWLAAWTYDGKGVATIFGTNCRGLFSFADVHMTWGTASLIPPDSVASYMSSFVCMNAQ